MSPINPDAGQSQLTAYLRQPYARRRLLLALSALGSTSLLAACDPFVRTYTRTVRMTIELQTPQGLVSSVGVLQIVAEMGSFRLGDKSGNSAYVAGDSIAIELPDGPVFATLTPRDSGPPMTTIVDGVVKALVPDKSNRPQGIDFYDAIKGLGGWFGGAKGELARTDWPALVRFKDLSDRKSAELVDPELIGIKRIVVETTSAHASTGLQKRLEWLDKASWFGDLVEVPRMTDKGTFPVRLNIPPK